MTLSGLGDSGLTMIDLVKFKQLLGPAGRELPDVEVERIREVEYGFANAIFEMWLRDRNTISTKKKDATNQSLI